MQANYFLKEASEKLRTMVRIPTYFYKCSRVTSCVVTFKVQQLKSLKFTSMVALLLMFQAVLRDSHHMKSKFAERFFFKKLLFVIQIYK